MPRAGTTTIYHHLQQHPGACLPFRKETFYFSFNHGRGAAWFRHLYRKARPGQVGFDISPDYFLDERTIDRMLAFDRSYRAILCVRDPVDWILSLYNQRARTDSQIPPFETFVRRYELTIGQRSTMLRLAPGFVPGMIDRFRAAFGDNLLLCDFRLLEEAPLRVVQAIEAFSGLPPHFEAQTFENVRLNASNQRHNRALYAWMNDERLVGALHRLLPERALSAARRRYYSAVRRDAPSDPRALHRSEAVALAERRYGHDRIATERLFAQYPLVLGSGQPFFVDQDMGSRRVG